MGQSDRATAQNNTSRFEDTWDLYDINSYVDPEPYATSSNPFASGGVASLQSMAKAFLDTNVAESLSDTLVNTDASRRTALKYNAGGRRVEHPEDVNILPMMMVHPHQTIDDHFLGTTQSGLKTTFKTDKTFTDPLGNVMEVWESAMPPPNKDYTLLNTHSNRSLERVQGYNMEKEYKKSEVPGEIPPAEVPTYKQDLSHRTNVSMMNSRDAYLNQNHLQPAADIDNYRKDMYDGYNVKNRTKLLNPVEPCWRDQHTSSSPRRYDASTYTMNGSMNNVNKDNLRRSELGAAYRRKPMIGISAKKSMITLPYVPEATLRASPTSFRTTTDASNMKTPIMNQQKDSKTVATGRNEISIDSFKSSGAQHGNLYHKAAEVDLGSPQREEVVVSMGSPEFAIAKRIAQEIKLAEGDDLEVSSILQKPREVAANARKMDPEKVYLSESDAARLESLPSMNVVPSNSQIRPYKTQFALGSSDSQVAMVSRDKDLVNPQFGILSTHRADATDVKHVDYKSPADIVSSSHVVLSKHHVSGTDAKPVEDTRESFSVSALSSSMLSKYRADAEDARGVNNVHADNTMSFKNVDSEVGVYRADVQISTITVLTHYLEHTTLM
jgi:hypothetical protein